MYDFSSGIAAGEKFPSGVLGFKPFDPTVLICHLPVPERAKCAVHCAIYIVGLNLILVNHGNDLSLIFAVLLKLMTVALLERLST